MTGNSWLMLIVLAGVGAAMEPKLTPYLLNLSEANLAASQKVVKPELETPELGFDLSAAKPEDFPKYFTLTEDWVASTKQGELMSVEAGSEWKYDHHHNEIVYFKGLDGITGNIHTGHTDMVSALREVIQNRNIQTLALKNAKAAKEAEQAKGSKGENKPKATAQQTSEESPLELVEKKEAQPPKQVVQIVQVEKKEKANTPEASLSPEQIVELMKTSVRKLREFDADEVISWSPGENGVDAEGESIQTGNVVYSAETLFGKKDIRAQAIIKRGIIEKWIWPSSGLEIY